MTPEQLERMSQCPIEDIPKSSLVNIRDVKIDTSLPDHERMHQYMEQIQNPYCFLCGDTPVRIVFGNEERGLAEALVEYFRTLKGQ